MRAKISLWVLFIIILPAVLAGCQLPEEEDPQPSLTAQTIDIPRARWISILIDGSVSFDRHLEASLGCLSSIIKSAGPGDRITLIRIGGSFDEVTHVRVFDFESVPQVVWQPCRTASEWIQRQETLTLAWRSTEKTRVAVLEEIRILSAPRPKERQITDIYRTLEYVATYHHAGEETYLIIASDLKHDVGAGETQKPPTASMSFEELHVYALFVDGLWENTEAQKAWEDFFHRSGASSVHLVNVAESSVADGLVPPSKKPVLLPKSFMK